MKPSSKSIPEDPLAKKTRLANDLLEKKATFSSMGGLMLQRYLGRFISDKKIAFQDRILSIDDLHVSFFDLQKMMCQFLEYLEIDYRIAMNQIINSLPSLGGDSSENHKTFSEFLNNSLAVFATSQEVQAPRATFHSLDHVIAMTERLERNGKLVQATCIARWAYEHYKHEIQDRAVRARCEKSNPEKKID